MVLARLAAADGGRLEPEKAVDAVNKILLAPMYLIYDLTTALLPGVLFFALMLAKHLELPTLALSSTLLGYRVKSYSRRWSAMLLVGAFEFRLRDLYRGCCSND